MNVEARVMCVIAKVLKVKIQDLPATASLGTFPRWDSLNHTNLIIELENEFDVAFDFDELDKIINISAIVDSLRNKI